jgi:hypothetical protein
MPVLMEGALLVVVLHLMAAGTPLSFTLAFTADTATTAVNTTCKHAYACCLELLPRIYILNYLAKISCITSLVQ